jgi:hypothetical protein
LGPNTMFSTFSCQNILFIFVFRPMLTLGLITLNAEFNSALYYSSFKQLIQEKYDDLGRNTAFSPFSASLYC